MKHLVYVLGFLFLAGNIAYAETTTFKQQILPIDCIYEVIDVGTQKLRYITPETCPIDPGPPVVTEPPVVPPFVDTTPLNTSSGRGWVYTSPIVITPPDQYSPDSSNSQQEVKGNVEYLRDKIVKNIDSVLLIAIGSLILIVMLITIHRQLKRNQ